ncbi:uncharacterized protein N7503_010799 [Penicillium pulvis]|uniref:uncharacterized protein n=1 Tax=Penicillium pulvis TaxID=1562058 RepID=UPI002549A75E|nr:uncharacterized protein N7503_010799 [Penicillium pulvis]KAJ5785587.1 hypothetical protein N7503_010799 [Penicillium pulvis]
MAILNNDVVLLIEDHLSYQPDKFSMMRVCRQWYALLLPRLFAKRMWVWGYMIYPLVRCIQINSNIGAAIQNLKVRLDFEPEEQRPEPKYDVRMVRDAVERACESRAEQTKWNRGLRMGDKDAWLAVLLQYLEGITVLRLSYSDKSDYFIPMLRRVAIRAAPFNTKPVLQRLEKVTVSTDEEKIHLLASDFLPLLSLPAMRVFNADGLYEKYEDNSLYPKPSPGISGIREMNLGRVCIGSNGIKGMADYITACANLEILEYQHCTDTPSRYVSLSFHSGAFYNALVTKKNSLRVLRLNDSGQSLAWGCDDEFENEEFNQFGSLFEFHHLRELRISVRTLLQFGHGHRPTVSLSTVLPSSLECLYLSHYWEEDFDIVVANLTSVATQRAERFSNLTKVRIQSSDVERVPRSEGGWKLELPESIHRVFAPLAEVFLEAGIDFGLCKPEWAAGRIA